MARYETYQSNAAEIPLMRKWILRALIISLLLHLGLLVFFHFKRLENFGNMGVERLAPPVRVMTRVNIPKIPDEETRMVIPVKGPNSAKIEIPEDKPEVQEVRVAPNAPEVAKPIVSEKPKVDATGWDAVKNIEATSRGSLEKELNSMAGSLIDKGQRSPRQPKITLPSSNRIGEAGTGDGAGLPGRQSVDQALDAMTKGRSLGNKPIGMPGGALFETDKAELKDVAVEQLQKLGELIKRNPNATFRIEGYSSSTGDAEHNIVLSQQRAEAVREWLVANFGVAKERIEAKGFGATNFIIPPEKSEDEQQPNRRVEIVIKTNRK